MSILVGKKPLLYRIYDDSDDEDRDDFIVKEVRCCDCFIDLIIKIIDNKKELTFQFLNEKVLMPRKLRFHKNDIFFLFSEICIFTCEKYKNMFENLFELDKNEMDKNCLAEYVDFNCLYFLSRETIFFSICEGCRRTLIIEISNKLIKIKI